MNSVASMKNMWSAMLDARVFDTKTGEELDDANALYLALAQDLQGTLEEHITVDWGPCATRRKQDVSNAPAWVWEAALAGHLIFDLTNKLVTVSPSHTHRYF